MVIFKYIKHVLPVEKSTCFGNCLYFFM